MFQRVNLQACKPASLKQEAGNRKQEAGSRKSTLATLQDFHLRIIKSHFKKAAKKSSQTGM
jgi:hypothetical protein